MKHNFRHCFGFVLFFAAIFSPLHADYLQKETTPTLKYLKPITIDLAPSEVDMIDCIYVINLDKRPEKWERMKVLFAEKGIHPNRVSGVEGWKLSEDAKKELAGPYHVRIPGGAYGCFLSHFSVYKDAWDRGFDIIWVCEDDLEFTGDIHQIPVKLKRLFEIDPDWDVFYTDVSSRDPFNSFFQYRLNEPGRPDQRILPSEYYAARIPIGDEMTTVNGRYGTYSMIISRKGLKKIIDYLSHTYVWTAIDCDLHFIPGIRKYASTTEIVTNMRRATSDTNAGSQLNPWNSLIISPNAKALKK